MGSGRFRGLGVLAAGPVLLAAVVAMAAGCGQSSDQDSAPRPPTSEPTRSAPAQPTEAGSVSSEGREPLPDTETTVQAARAPVQAASAHVEVLRTIDPRLGARWPDLATFGYHGRLESSPGANRTSEGFDLPEFVLAGLESDAGDAAGTGLEVVSVQLGWGIDSTGLLIAVDGPVDEIRAVEPALRRSADRLVAGETWLAGLYRSGLASTWELDDLADIIGWIMNPEGVCRRSAQACPLGPDVGFPPPPPTLAVPVDAIFAPVPFDLLDLPVGAERFTVSGGSMSWMEGGRAFTRPGWTEEAETADLGPASAVVGYGSLRFAVEPQAGGGRSLTLRICCQDAAGTEAAEITGWELPTGWEVEGLALFGRAGQDRYHLLVTGQSGAAPLAVAVPVDLALLNGDRSAAAPPVDLEALPAVALDSHRWTRPQTRDGGVSVVEQRSGGWYLVDDALGARLELLRSPYPISGYTIGPGSRHIVVVVDGPDRSEVLWVRDDVVEVIGRGPAPVGWVGRYPIWAE